MALGPPPVWIDGALICLFGSTLTALGLVLQKHSHVVAGRATNGDGPLGGEHSPGTAYFLQKWWVAGFSIFTAAQLINMVSMAMTPQVVLSCLGAWTLVCNEAFAHLVLGETISRKQAAAVAGLVVATAMVIYNSPQPDLKEEARDRNVALLALRFVSPEFELLTATMLGIAAATRLLAAGWPSRAAVVLPDGATRSAPPSPLLPASWATTAAVTAGYTALLFKCLAEIAAGAAAARDGASQPPWRCWETYAIAATALSCAPAELHCLNRALQCGEAVTVVPTYLALGMLSQLATGAVFFREFRGFTSAEHAAGFFFSVLLTLAFVVAVAVARATEVVEGTADGNGYTPLSDEPEAPAEPPPAAAAKKPSRREEPASLAALHAAEDLALYGKSVDSRHEVSVAGFGGAIECLDSGRARRRWPSPAPRKTRSGSSPF